MAQAIGSICTRCDGTGIVDAEDQDGSLGCPYFDVAAGVECHDGLIVAITHADR